LAYWRSGWRRWRLMNLKLLLSYQGGTQDSHCWSFQNPMSVIRLLPGWSLLGPDPFNGLNIFLKEFVMKPEWMVFVLLFVE
jgi:hypothetical protein